MSTDFQTKPGYKKTKLGWIPEEWELMDLGDVSSKIGSGSTPRGGEQVYTKEGIPFIRSQNVNGNKLFLDDIRFIPVSVHEAMKGTVVRANDILLNITGASIGRSCVVPSDFEEGNVNQHVCIIRLSNLTIPSFIQFFLTSYYGQKTILQSQVGGNREGLNHSNVRRIKVPLPPLPEQRQIARILSTWDKAIDSLQKLIAKKQERKKGLMQALLSGKKRFKGFDGEWKDVRIGELNTYKKKSLEPARFPDEDFLHFSIPAYSAGEKPDLVKGSELKSAKLIIKSEAILFGKLNPRVWKVWWVQIDSETRKITSTEFVPLQPNDKVMAGYLYQALHTNWIKYRVDQLIGGSTGSHQRISPKDFYRLKIKLPSLKEQQKIACVLSAADREIEKLQGQLEKLREQKKGLMQKLLTGEVRTTKLI